MAGIPTNFQAISNVLANYNFVDIASGTGYIIFYAGETYASAEHYCLTNNTFYSDVYINGTTMSSGVSSKIIDLDFDILLNRPLDLKGKAIINIPTYITAANGWSTGYVIAKIRKWDGTTETDIASGQGINISPAKSSTLYKYNGIDITIPLTHFKLGEYIRLTIEGWVAHTSDGAGSNSGLYVAYDPVARTTGWDGTGVVPSKLLFQCPVRLNL